VVHLIKPSWYLQPILAGPATDCMWGEGAHLWCLVAQREGGLCCFVRMAHKNFEPKIG
jgi:hypothetical protein